MKVLVLLFAVMLAAAAWRGGWDQVVEALGRTATAVAAIGMLLAVVVVLFGLWESDRWRWVTVTVLGLWGVSVAYYAIRHALWPMGRDMFRAMWATGGAGAVLFAVGFLAGGAYGDWWARRRLAEDRDRGA